MLRHIDSRDGDTARYSRNTLLLASSLLLGAALVPAGFGALSEQPLPEPLLSVPAVLLELGQGLEASRPIPRERDRPASSPPVSTVKAFARAWAAGDRVAARRVASRGVYRDMTRLAGRFAMAAQPTGPPGAFCSGDREVFCRVYLPGMLEVDARLALRHGEFVVLGFKLPAAG